MTSWEIGYLFLRRDLLGDNVQSVEAECKAWAVRDGRRIRIVKTIETSSPHSRTLIRMMAMANREHVDVILMPTPFHLGGWHEYDVRGITDIHYIDDDRRVSRLPNPLAVAH